jgi:two-component system sensor histidine kinase/response regulator
LGGDSDLAFSLLLDFIELYADSGKKLSETKASSKEYDEYLHTLKGISGNLSLVSLYDITSQMYATKEKKTRDKLLPKFVEILIKSVKAIEAYLQLQSCKESLIEKDKDEFVSLIDEVIGYCSEGSVIPAQSLKKLLGILHHEVVHEVLEVEHALAQYDYEKAIRILEDIKKGCFHGADVKENN